MVGHWHGGLGLAGVLACALFAAVSGSSPATVVAIGSMLPAMTKAGFPKQFGAGIITTSGALGILIPPSIVMVMYSVSTNTSVGAVHGRRHPGLLLAFLLGLTAGGGPQVRLPAHEEGHPGRALEGLPRIGLGPAADRHRDGRHLHRPVHADRGGHERGLRLLHRRVRLQGHGPEGRAACC
jgi:hypothetical protein